MVRIKLMLAVLALMFVASATATQAATLRAFVSSTGNDANAATNCAQTAPCRTFAAAYPTVTPAENSLRSTLRGTDLLPSLMRLRLRPYPVRLLSLWPQAGQTASLSARERQI